MNIKGISFLVLALLFLVPLTVSAEPYNITTDSDKIYSKQYCVVPPFLTTPLDPKIACDSDGSNCLALVYDTCTTSSVRVLWSVDGFDTHSKSLNPIGSGISQTEWIDQYYTDGSALYYDIAYYEPQRAFYMVFGSNVYVAFSEDTDGAGPLQPLPTIYTPSSPLVTSDQTYGDTISIDCATEITTPKDWAGLGYYCILSETYGMKFEDGNATNLWGIQLCQPRDTSPSDWDGLLCEWNYDVTNTTVDRFTNAVALNYTESCSSGGNFGTDFISVNTFYSGSDWKYNIEGQVDYCTGTVDVAIAEDTLGTPQDDWNQHYFGGNLYYRNFSLPNASGSILQSETSDFSSFGSAETVYTEDSSVNETINQSDSTTAGNQNLYIWERNSATDQGNDGIWVHRQSNIPITIETEEDTPVNAVLDCTTDTGSTYTDTGSGDLFTLNTLCQTGNRIIFTSAFRPTTAIEYFDIDNSCLTSGLTIQLKYAEIPYTHTVEVRTFDENIVVPNANVTIGTDQNTTDANGIATFELTTLSGTSLDRVNSSTCLVKLSTDGTGTSESITVEKTGFRDGTDTIPAPSKSVSNEFNIWTVSSYNLVSLRETGIFLDVDIRAGGGTEIESCDDGGYTATVSGPDVIKVSINGVEITRAYATSFPATFVMNHSSSPVNVSVTLVTPDNDTLLEYADMAYDSENEITFDIERGITNLTCDHECDCPDSVCIDEYFYDKLGCLDELCNYDVYDCVLPELCDDVAGCFDTTTTQSCSSDSDCSDFNYCVDSSTMIQGVCGSTGVCLNKTVECVQECNTTANVCEEQRLCLNPTPQTFQVGTNSFQITCDQSNAGTQFCGYSVDVGINQSGIQLLKDQVITTYGSIAGVPVQPTGWNYIETTNALGDEIYLFLTPRITCTETCEMEIEFCGANGCDQDTGECLGVGSGVDPIATLFAGWSLAITGMINYIFPDIYSKSIFSLIVMLVVSVAMLLIGREQKDIALLILGVNIIIALVFTFVGFFPFYVAIISAILAGFLVFQGLFNRGG